jgi:hypothetical protein
MSRHTEDLLSRPTEDLHISVLAHMDDDPIDAVEEAARIARGESFLLPTREHLRVLWFELERVRRELAGVN